MLIHRFSKDTTIKKQQQQQNTCLVNLNHVCVQLKFIKNKYLFVVIHLNKYIVTNFNTSTIFQITTITQSLEFYRHSTFCFICYLGYV